MNERNSLSGAELINPYSEDTHKGHQVEQMFDNIAPAYDFMNSAMSFGLHKWWLRKSLTAAAKAIGSTEPRNILDIATGTGDVAFDLHRDFPDADILGVDLSAGMLEIAKKKLAGKDEGTKRRITFRKGDSLALDIADNSQDLITVAYGVRNFEHLKQGYEEMFRVLRPGGVLCVIELSCPENRLLLSLYNIYSRRIIPAFGKMISHDTRAYTYLPESIAAAPQRRGMTAIMESCGFSKCSWKSLTFGAITYYIAHK